jgi:hypothetical protein
MVELTKNTGCIRGAEKETDEIEVSSPLNTNHPKYERLFHDMFVEHFSVFVRARYQDESIGITTFEKVKIRRIVCFRSLEGLWGPQNIGAHR